MRAVSMLTTSSIIDYSRDLRPAEWGLGVDLHGTNLGPAMSLWVKSGHRGTSAQCPLKPPKADIKLVSVQRGNSGSLAMFAAIRRASSLVSSLAAARRPGSSS